MAGKDSRRGQSLVEFALLLPILVILLLGLLDLGRLFYAYVGVSGAAAEGAAYGATIARRPDLVLEDEVTLRVIESTEGLVQVDGDQVEVSPVLGESTSLTVTVTYDFELLTPLVRTIVSDGVLPLRAVAVRGIGPG